MINRNFLKRTVIGLLLVLIIGCSVGSTLALLIDQSIAVKNVFTPVEADVEIDEIFENNIKSSIIVKNTGDCDVYVRVKLLFGWKSADGKPYGQGPWSSVDEVSYNSDKWALGLDGYFYYKGAVAVDGATVNLLTSPIELKVVDGLNQSLEVMATCVQAKPASAVKDLWGDTAAKLVGAIQ